QVDDAPVQAHQLVFETELLPPALVLHQFLAFEHGFSETLLDQFPRPMLIGVGQRGSLGCHRHPQMLQLPLATRQAAANLAQRMRLSQLAKQHGHELAPTGETPRVPFSLVLLDRLFEIPAREQLQHLRENAAYFVHRLSLLRLNWFFPNPIQRIRGSTSHRQRRPPLRPAVSPLIWTAVSGATITTSGGCYGAVSSYPGTIGPKRRGLHPHRSPARLHGPRSCRGRTPACSGGGQGGRLPCRKRLPHGGASRQQGSGFPGAARDAGLFACPARHRKGAVPALSRL